MQPVTFYIDPEFGALSEVASSCITQMLGLAGHRAQRTARADAADLVYSPHARGANALACAGVAAWRNLADAAPLRVDDYVHPSVSAAPAANGEMRIDLVLSSHYFLSGGVERRREAQEEPAIPGHGAQPWGILTRPVVQQNVRALAQLLPRAARPALRWPAGKSWALCITHDCDQPLRFLPGGFLRDAGREARRGRVVRSGLSMLKSAYSALGRVVSRDPFFASWQAWVEAERRLGIRSAFYLASRSRHAARADERDVGYSIHDRRIVHRLRELCEDGWEIGLHSAIGTWREQDGFARQARILEQITGRAPVGLRAHFWSLDAECPERSLAQAARQGFVYDSSLGMNVVHGFRRGTCYPYQPYDPDNGTPCGLVELPPIIMDWALHVGGADNAQRAAALAERVRAVRDHEGLLILDWHEYTLAPGIMSGFAADLVRALAAAASDSSCWLTTPAEVAEWCNRTRWKSS